MKHDFILVEKQPSLHGVANEFYDENKISFNVWASLKILIGITIMIGIVINANLFLLALVAIVSLTVSTLGTFKHDSFYYQLPDKTQHSIFIWMNVHFIKIWFYVHCISAIICALMPVVGASLLFVLFAIILAIIGEITQRSCFSSPIYEVHIIQRQIDINTSDWFVNLFPYL